MAAIEAMGLKRIYDEHKRRSWASARVDATEKTKASLGNAQSDTVDVKWKVFKNGLGDEALSHVIECTQS